MLAALDKVDSGHVQVLWDITATDCVDQCGCRANRGTLGICCDGVGEDKSQSKFWQAMLAQALSSLWPAHCDTALLETLSSLRREMKVFP